MTTRRAAGAGVSGGWGRERFSISTTCNHQTAEGIAGWAAVAATVAAYDGWALHGGHETLSSAYAAASRHPVGRVVLLAADAVLLAHLWRWPRSAARFDPLDAAARRLSGGSAVR
ncbi:MAG: hypothetical protein M0Z42_06795 [Actinomycetota bacterium]|nr:hypothetical protein [Actinomycetota bacterium]